MGQYIPKISEKDIARIIERKYEPELRPLVAKALREFGYGENERGVLRVRMAILKLSSDLQTVERMVGVARYDYREVLGEAESPYISEIGFEGLESMPKSEIKRLYRKDKEQYLNWLKQLSENKKI